jgi:TRAP-type C4-dicarboxylate transport system permease small subunit
MLVVCADVFLRYFFNRPMFWVLESTQFALVFITFLGAAWVLKNDGHVRMDIVINRFSQRTQDRINIVTSILCAVACLVVTWYGVKVWWDYFQINYLYAGSLVIPAYYLEAVIPIGGFLLFIQFLRKAYGYLGKLKAS